MAVTINGTTGIETNTDTGKVKVGADDDLQIYHNGTDSYLQNDTGILIIDSDSLSLRSKTGGEAYLTATVNGATKLRFDNSTKFETTSGGASVTGHLLPGAADTYDLGANTTPWRNIWMENDLYIEDNGMAVFGTGEDLKIYHGGTDSVINNGTGHFYIQGENQLTIKANNNVEILKAAGDEAMAKFIPDGAVELYYNNSKKLETKNDGIIISQEVVLGNAGNTTPWTASGDVAHGVLLNSQTANVKFPITANSNDTNTCILNRTNGNGRILVFKYNGSVVGNIDSNGASLPSDRDFKTNISDLNLGLSLVNKLKPSQFNYKIDDANTPVMYGLIAQEFEEAITSEGITKNSTQLIQHHPTDDTESNYSVDYLKLVPILINSIKELSTEVNTLKTEKTKLQTDLTALTARVAALEAA